MKKPKKSTLTNKLDKICSEIVHHRGRCERCGNRRTLQCCHIFSRSNRSVRWSLINLLCLCAGCHFWGHKNPVLFTEFVRGLLSKEGYDELKQEAIKIKKWTIEELEELYNRLKQEVEKC